MYLFGKCYKEVGISREMDWFVDGLCYENTFHGTYNNVGFIVGVDTFLHNWSNLQSVTLT